MEQLATSTSGPGTHADVSADKAWRPILSLSLSLLDSLYKVGFSTAIGPHSTGSNFDWATVMFEKQMTAMCLSFPAKRNTLTGDPKAASNSCGSQTSQTTHERQAQNLCSNQSHWLLHSPGLALFPSIATVTLGFQARQEVACVS